MKSCHDAENQYHRDAIAVLRRDYDRNRARLSVLLGLGIDKSISENTRQAESMFRG